MAGVLWLYWKYFNGSWWPKTTAEARRKSFRDVKLSAGVWKWGLVAAVLFVVVVQSGLVITFRIIEFPAEAFTAEYHLGVTKMNCEAPSESKRELVIESLFVRRGDGFNNLIGKCNRSFLEQRTVVHRLHLHRSLLGFRIRLSV